MALIAAATAVAMGGMQLFGYNRENFMEDREQRMKKEYAERRFRVTQAHLFRQDVRHIVSLTEKKMSILLLVNTLVLGFTVTLWSEGRLPETTPAWLTMGMQIAIAGAFLFLVLAVWMAMHAAVAAQSYQTRILTQLVRLPIPSWEELDACRTHASDFERVDVKQMLRVPFARKQEDLARESAAPADAATAGGVEADGGGSGAPGLPGLPAAGGGLPATDPWGLERCGGDTYELGASYGKDCASLRHVKLIRQAAVYWQTYEAWARTSMSVGFNQLILGLSYFVVGYTITENDEVMPGFVAVTILVATSYLVSVIDLTLSFTERWIFQAALAFGPGTVLLAAYRWNRRDEWAADASETFAPTAFFSHAVVVGFITVLVKVRTQENGAMLPLAFKNVLFLDVFGWVWHKQAAAKEAGELPQGQRALPVEGGLADPFGSVGYSAEDYFSMPALGSGGRPQDASSGGEPESEPGSVNGDAAQAPRPATACIAFDSAGRPLPARPEDLRPEHCLQDLRGLPGAPSSAGPVDAVDPSGKEFWEPVTFMPSEVRDRGNFDEYWQDGAGFEHMIETGHDNETPGLMPWTIFRNASAVTSAIWIAAGLYYVLQASNATNVDPRPPVPPHVSALANETFFDEFLSRRHQGIYSAVAGTAMLEELPSQGNPERVHITWPYEGVAPQSLACDGASGRLLLLDGVSMYTAQLSAEPEAARRAARDRRLRQRGSALRADGRAAWSASFAAARPCPAVAGQSLEDAAVVCAPEGGGNATCEALVLHDRGQRLSSCSLAPAAVAAEGSGFSAPLAQSWLQDEDGPLAAAPGGARESARWLVLDAGCARGSGGSATEALRLGCVSVGTTGGRVAKLQHSVSSGAVFPTEAYTAVQQSAGTQAVPLQLLRGVGADRFGFVRRGALMLQRAAGAGAGAGAGSVGEVAVEQGDPSTDSVSLPGSLPVAAFCVGGGGIVAMAQGPNPVVWRLPMSSLPQ